jgi:Glycosyltransferase family 9 (heptosyltransferase)
MFVKMLESLGTPAGPHEAGEIYEVPDAIGVSWVRACMAEPSRRPPSFHVEFLKRLDDGAGEPCLFLPFLGEFGHLVMSHLRIVHFHRASRKIVCCKPGQEVLFPGAAAFCTDWTDPVPDDRKVASMRSCAFEWPRLINAWPGRHVVHSGNLTRSQEVICIEPNQRIAFRPKRRGLIADVVLGIRKRGFAPEKNWPHWHMLAAMLRAEGLTFAVAADRLTSFDLQGQVCHSGDYDTDAAVELMSNCRVYVGTDSGASHLAATVGSPMVVWRLDREQHRDLLPRMQQVNPDVTIVPQGWDHPRDVLHAILAVTQRSRQTPGPSRPYISA